MLDSEKDRSGEMLEDGTVPPDIPKDLRDRERRIGTQEKLDVFLKVV